MDELLIDEKKYVSSKQAAKITGYAKDYIGQLCREGRVPARLVGRSWYVLEAAIQDHRFGNPVVEAKKEVLEETPTETLPWTRQAPRYEASPIEFLPTINRPKPNEIKPPVEDVQEEIGPIAPETLQNAWKEWFDRVGETITSVTAPQAEPEPEPELEIEKEVEVPQEIPQDYQEIEETSGAGVNIPIHSIYRAPPREILPQYTREEVLQPVNEDVGALPLKRQRGNRVVMRVIKIISLILMVLSASVGVIGSGLLDKFIMSANQVTSISGITIYNK
jgi:hypothetical protein